MSVRNPGSVFVSVSGVCPFSLSEWPPLLLLNAFPPDSCLSVCLGHPEVYQKLQKPSSREEEGTFACVRAVFLVTRLRLHGASDVLAVLLTHSSCVTDSELQIS